MLFLLSAFRLVSKKIVFLICLVLLLFHIFLPPKLLSGSFSIIHPLCSTVISLSILWTVPTYTVNYYLRLRDTDLQQEGHWQAAYLTLQPGQWGQASLAEPRRFPPDFTGELRGLKPPRLRLLQETQNYLRRGRVCIAGHVIKYISLSCEQPDNNNTQDTRGGSSEKRPWGNTEEPVCSSVTLTVLWHIHYKD